MTRLKTIEDENTRDPIIIFLIYTSITIDDRVVCVGATVSDKISILTKV